MSVALWLTPNTRHPTPRVVIFCQPSPHLPRGNPLESQQRFTIKPWLYSLINPMALSNLAISTDVLLTGAVYLGLAGVYLVVIPLALLLYLKGRWYTAGSIERTLLYGLVFAFFPGMLLFSPFLNFRPQMRNVD